MNRYFKKHALFVLCLFLGQSFFINPKLYPMREEVGAEMSEEENPTIFVNETFVKLNEIFTKIGLKLLPVRSDEHILLSNSWGKEYFFIQLVKHLEKSLFYANPESSSHLNELGNRLTVDLSHHFKELLPYKPETSLENYHSVLQSCCKVLADTKLNLTIIYKLFPDLSKLLMFLVDKKSMSQPTSANKFEPTMTLVNILITTFKRILMMYAINLKLEYLGKLSSERLIPAIELILNGNYPIEGDKIAAFEEPFQWLHKNHSQPSQELADLNISNLMLSAKKTILGLIKLQFSDFLNQINKGLIPDEPWGTFVLENHKSRIENLIANSMSKKDPLLALSYFYSPRSDLNSIPIPAFSSHNEGVKVFAQSFPLFITLKDNYEKLIEKNFFECLKKKFDLQTLIYDPFNPFKTLMMLINLKIDNYTNVEDFKKAYSTKLRSVILKLHPDKLPPLNRLQYNIIFKILTNKFIDPFKVILDNSNLYLTPEKSLRAGFADYVISW